MEPEPVGGGAADTQIGCYRRVFCACPFKNVKPGSSGRWSGNCAAVGSIWALESLSTETLSSDLMGTNGLYGGGDRQARGRGLGRGQQFASRSGKHGRVCVFHGSVRSERTLFIKYRLV